jgi:tetratricopeptide (TPR) repeat protein
MRSFDVVYEALSNIDSRKAAAREAKDLAAINLAVERSVTHAGLNTLVKEVLRKWVVEMIFKELMKREQAGDGFKLADFQYQAAVVLWRLGELKEAEKVIRDCLKFREDNLGDKHRDTLSCINLLGNIVRGQGKYDEAESLYRSCLAACEDTKGPKHPDTLNAVNNLASLLADQGKSVEAEALYRRALQGYEEVLGLSHPNTLRGVNGLAIALHNQGQLGEAELLYRRAVAGAEENLGPNHPDTLLYVGNLARLLRDQGSVAEAESLFRRALSGLKDSLGEAHEITAYVSGGLGVLHMRLGESDEVRAREGRLEVEAALHRLRDGLGLPADNVFVKEFTAALAE